MTAKQRRPFNSALCLYRYLMEKLKKIEKSISNSGIVYAVISFPVTILFSYFTASILGLESSECMKCQDNGDIWFLTFAISLFAFGYFGYQLGIKRKIASLLKSGKINKASLSKMSFNKSLYKHEL